MTIYHGIGLFIVGYILLLARSAWKQGELRQFLRSLVLVAILFGVVFGIVAAYVELR